MSQSLSDRNLLFGILALQNDFLSREELIAAVSVWLQNKARPLDEILRERRTLGDEEHRLLSDLVRVHLARHGNDTEKSLASLSSVASVHKELTKLGDPEVATSLVHFAKTHRAEEPPLTVNFAASTTTSSGSRFQVLGAHARGGLGEVFVAEDTELNREVALKQIQIQEADNPDSRARFLLEAKITGGLEHPGIVPVYGLGHYNDGRPYYAMRFIRGSSLQEAVTQSPHDGAPHDGARPLRKLLGRFIDVCDAIEYAHARGVLHRDLKPENIMLGQYGETLVVDWGLAKSMGASKQRDASQSTLSPLSIDGSQQTRLGSVLGTPAYMSPEQASGSIDQLNETSDVYSLGATLYYVLTGKPPFGDEGANTLLNKVRSGEFSPPREKNSHVPRELEAICLKAMSLRAADRYPRPSVLAEDLEKWLADEPVSAYPEPFAQRLRRWGRQHRTLVTSAAATILMALLCLAVVVAMMANYSQALAAKNIQLDRTNDRLTKTNSDLRTARNLAETKRQEAETARASEASARQQAEIISDFLVRVFRSPDPSRNGRTITIAEVLDRTASELKNQFAENPQIKAALLEAIGRAYLGLGLWNESVPVFEQASVIWTPELGAQPHETFVITADLAQAYARTGRPNDAIPLFEKQLQLSKDKYGLEDSQTVAAMNDLANAYGSAGRFDEAVSLLKEALRLGKIVYGKDDPTTLGIMGNLANVYQHMRRLEDALPLLEEALRIRQTIAPPDDVETLANQASLAFIYLNVNRVDEGLKMFEEVWKRQKVKLGDQHPDTLETMQGLAHAYLYSGRQADAISLMEVTLKLTKASVGDNHPRVAVALNSLATFYQGAGRLNDALPLFEESFRIRTSVLGAKHPDTLGAAMWLSRSYIAAARFDEALPLLEQTFELRSTTMGTDDPSTINTLGTLAEAYLKSGQAEKALPLYDQYVTKSKIAYGTDQPGFADLLDSVSLELLTHREFKVPQRYLGESLQIRKTVLPDDWTVFSTTSMLGAALAGQQKFTEAEPLLIEGYQGLKEREAKIPQPQDAVFSAAIQRLVDLYTAWEKPDDVEKWRALLPRSDM